jgi:hypothetical protein
VPVTVTDEYVEALRLFLTDDDAFEQLSSQLEERDGRDGGNVYAALVGMAFAVAARRRFGPSYRSGDVIRLVAHARTALQDSSGDIDPRTAERMLRAVLCDNSTADGLGEQARALAIPALLAVMVDQLGLSDSDLDAFLAEACSLADRVLAEGREDANGYRQTAALRLIGGRGQVLLHCHPPEWKVRSDRNCPAGCQIPVADSYCKHS